DPGAQILAGIAVVLSAVAPQVAAAGRRGALVAAAARALSVAAAGSARARDHRPPLQTAVAVQIAAGSRSVARTGGGASGAFVLTGRAAVAVGADFADGAGD